MMLKVGDVAPTFSAASDTAGTVDLAKLRGRKVVLFFYPKDDTPGCTKESCEFRDLAADFEKAGAAVFGVSADDVDSHKRFASKYNLNFPLLAYPEHKICESYGVWGEQEWQGKKYMGIARTTYVVGGDGKIARVYPGVNPVGHAAQVLADVKAP